MEEHNKIKYSFLIAAPRSNSGKTLITLGLIKALCNKGLDVQAFKCGPDYIDPFHHKYVSGKPSYNLDTWMDSPQNIKKLYNLHLNKADIGITEGVMGLFDGAKKDEGSSASIARLLSLPVVLIVDVSSVAYSIAPLLFGFKNFDPRIKIAGVIFNKTASESHVHILKEAAIDAGVRMLGFIPRDERLKIESRHLGLHLPGESQNNEIIDVAASLVEKYVNIDLILEISRINQIQTENRQEKEHKGRFSCAFARDKAFNFTYQANLDTLEELGSVQFFSPLEDKFLPDVDLVWLPGGYPELFARQLSENASMLNSIREHINAGKALIAECGGMMYLGDAIIDKNGEKFDMAGVYHFSTSFENMKIHLGYRELFLNDLSIRGHEFHYSQLVNTNQEAFISQANTSRGFKIDMPVYKFKKCWASYMHLYLGNTKKMTDFLDFIDV